MARDIKVTRTDDHGNVVRLVQDIHDDPTRTDRWFVEVSLRFRGDRSPLDANSAFEEILEVAAGLGIVLR